jgi:hypothetical protein
MFTEESDARDRWLVALLVIAVFGALIAIRLIARSKPEAAQVSAAAPSQNDFAIEAEPETALDRAPVPIAPDSIARIYECEHDGQRVLSDQPCGSGATVRLVREPNRMQAQDTSRWYERRYHSYRQQSSDHRPARTTAGTASSCEQIQREIDAINASMRQGYKNAERRRQRLRDLSKERWDLECRFLKTPASLRN